MTLSSQKLIRKDKYFKKAGGTAKIINVACSKCKGLLFVYQKDYPRGWLKRCYLNRIINPKKYERLQYDKRVKEPKDLGNLICHCGEIIGNPIRHKSGRFAFRLIKGKFERSNYKNE